MRKATFLATLTTVSVGVSALLVLPATAAPGLASWAVQDAGTPGVPAKAVEKIATAVTDLSVAAGSAGTQERVLVTGRVVESTTSLFPLSRMPVTVRVRSGADFPGVASKCQTSTDAKGTFRCTVSSRRNGAGLTVTATFSGNQLFAASTASITMDDEAVPATTPTETSDSTPAPVPETDLLVPGAIVPLPADSFASPQTVLPTNPAPELPVVSPSTTPGSSSVLPSNTQRPATVRPAAAPSTTPVSATPRPTVLRPAQGAHLDDPALATGRAAAGL